MTPIKKRLKTFYLRYIAYFDLGIFLLLIALTLAIWRNYGLLTGILFWFIGGCALVTWRIFRNKENLKLLEMMADYIIMLKKQKKEKGK